MRKILVSVLAVSMLLTSCKTNTVSTNKQKGTYNYVKDNTYYMVSADGTRYALGNDSVENNEAYTNRQNRKEIEALIELGYASIFDLFNMGLGLNSKTIKDKFSEKNYYPNNYIDFDKNFTLLEYAYNKQEDIITLNISTNSIIKKDSVKRAYQDEKEIIHKSNDEETSDLETTAYETTENKDIEVEIDDQIFEKIDSMMLGENENNDVEENFNISTESEIIDEFNEINGFDEVKNEDNLFTIGKKDYYFDKQNNCIYYKSVGNVFEKINLNTYEKEVIDNYMIEKIRFYDKNNIIYNKINQEANGEVENELVFFSVKKGKENVYKIPSVRQIIFDDYNKDKVYVLTNDESRSLYLINKKNGMTLVDEKVSDVYGITKKNIYYSKYTDIGIPYSLFLIDNVSTGEWLGEEPKLSDYKNNDDPFSFDFDIDGYTAARFSYKYKEKFLNDRRKYVDRNIENIKSNNYKYSLSKLYSYDGKSIKELNENYLRKVYILNPEKDIIYFETDNNIMNIPINKKTLGEFVTGDVLIDQYIEGYFDETKKQFLSYIKNDDHMSNIKDLDLYRGYMDKNSPLYYDTKYRSSISRNERRNITMFENTVFINSISNSKESEVTYSIDLSKDSILFPDSINMDGFSKIKIIDYINEPIYILYNDNSGTLKHGIRTVDSNVVVDSIVLNKSKSKIAYVVKTDSEVSGILHKRDTKDYLEDTIVSENAFYYNLCFDSMDDALCYLVDFNQTEEYGTFLTFDDNNKITFIDDEVMYIIKN